MACLLLSLLIAASSAASSAASPTAYPNFSDFRGTPFHVGYTNRALTLNSSPVIFMSGSLHPPRGTVATWVTWFEQAVANGLNMVEVYVFWNFHEPTEGHFNWEGSADLVRFLDMAGEAGLFVNLRIGPYVCAEWTYGGLPVWLGLKPGVSFRQTNAVWQAAMEQWFGQVVNLTAAAKLFATQGGPIVLMQVENELPSTDVPYVAWCGHMAEAALKAAGVSVPITMCNGETANNTINTCNGNDCVSYLQSHGQSGRILRDQPALWTENEGGFQVWGSSPAHDPAYFWGRAVSELSYAVLRWVARGGSHMNYYMWAGGSNFGRWAGSGITTMYASDAIMCPDNLPHQPKFDHTKEMHGALSAVAAQLVSCEAQLDKPHTPLLPYNGWQPSKQHVAFIYGDAMFLESAATQQTTVNIAGYNFTMPPLSVSICNVKTGQVHFNSATVAPATAHRTRTDLPVKLQWEQWQEPLSQLPLPLSEGGPLEHALITNGLTQFVYYQVQTEVKLQQLSEAGDASLSIHTSISNAFLVYVDGKWAAAVDDHSHNIREGVVLTTSLHGLTPGNHTLTIVSEELGYPNYGFTQPLHMGIVGEVTLGGVSLSVGHRWRMQAGLMGEHKELMTPQGSKRVNWQCASSTIAPLSWLQAHFTLPAVGEGRVLLNVGGLGRGQLYVNGQHLGRYWSIAAFNESKPTQQLYHIPSDMLVKDNLLTLAEVQGAQDLSSVHLMVSTMATGAGPTVDATTVVTCSM